MTFAIIDIIFAVIILVVAINAAIKGLVYEILGKAAFVMGVLFAILFYKNFTSVMMKYITNQTLAALASFLLIFIVVFLIISIVKVILNKIFAGEVLGGLNKALGFFFGIIEGLLLISLIIIALELQPFFDVNSLFEGSVFHKMLNNFLVVPEQRISESINIAYSSISNNSFRIKGYV